MLFRLSTSLNNVLQSLLISSGRGSSQSYCFALHMSCGEMLALIVTADAKPRGSYNLEMFNRTVLLVSFSTLISFTAKLMTSVCGFQPMPKVLIPYQLL